MIFGILFCGFAVVALVLQHQQHKALPLQWQGFLALFFIWGIWMLISGLLRADAEGALSYFVGSFITAVFAAVVLLMAWLQKDSWSGGIPFVSSAWNQILARSVVALGGLLLAITSVAFFRKAVRLRGKV
jgi:hypothetical protein